MNRHFCVVTAALLVFATSCTPAPSRVDTHDADIKAIKDDQIQWLKDFDSRDLDKIVSHFSDDAIVIDKGAPPVKGREEAKKLYKDAAADPASSLKFAPLRIEVAKSGEIGYVLGSYTAVGTVPNTKKTAEDRGTYVSIYKKQSDGSWKDVVDIGASEVPLTPPGKE
jgi:ketosteroid isomerase-like protein